MPTPPEIYYEYQPSRLLAVIATALFAISTLAHCYQMLGRRTWFLIPFIIGGLFSIFGYAIRVYSAHNRTNIALGGICLQMISFGLFFLTALIFHIRASRRPTSLSANNSRWRTMLWALYACSVLIYIRCTYRLVGFEASSKSAIRTKEIYFYVFDTLMMLTMSYTLNIFHPHRLNKIAEFESDRDGTYLQGV